MTNDVPPLTHALPLQDNDGSEDEQLVQVGRRQLPAFDQWPTVDESALSQSRREIYLPRRAALKLYMSGAKISEISRQTGVAPSFLYRMLRKVGALHPDGRIWGLRAAIPWVRTHPNDGNIYRAASGDTTWAGPGAFGALLGRHPELVDFIRDHVLKLQRGKRNKIYESRKRVVDLHSEFLKKCREFGLNPLTDYPFTGKYSGYISLAKYVKKILAESSPRAQFIKYGENALKKMRVGDGSQRPIFRPYERVECDAHHIDALFCILLTNTEGGVFPMVLPRLWVIAITEVESRVILGHYLSLNKECTQEDLLKCIQNALSPWQPRDLSGSHLSYRQGAGFPASVNDRLIGVCWDEFSVDGAKINLSDRVRTKLDTIVGSRVVLLPRRVPDDRPFIERFFGTLEERGFHRLPNTTGNSPDDIRRSAPEAAACRFFIQLEDLENLLDILIANYNATVHSSLGGRTPLEYLQWSLQRGNMLASLRRATPEAVKRIGAEHTSLIVRGGRGRRPFVNLCYGTYSCPAFSHAQELVGKTITAESFSDDARVIFAYLPDGQELGPLTAAPPWNREPHTFLMRKLIKARARSGKWHEEDYQDPVVSLLYDLENRAKATGKVSSEFLQLRRYLLERRQQIYQMDDIASFERHTDGNTPSNKTSKRDAPSSDGVPSDMNSVDGMPAPKMAKQVRKR